MMESKYPAINDTPKAGPSKERSEPPPTSPSPPQKTPKRSINGAGAEPQLLYTGDIDISWLEKYNIASGLYNNGNTCFLNSALQCLLHTPPLLRVIVHQHDKDSCRVKNAFCMACNMRQLILRAHSGKSPFSPDMITNKIQVIAKHLRRGRQEDSHEFLRYAIDALQKSCLAGQPQKIDPKIAETTWVHKIFGGKLRSRVTCQSCGHNSDTFDSNLDLSLDIYKVGHLKEAFRRFFTPDHLNGKDKYKCEKCKKAVNAEKRFSVEEAPMVLTVHLKRFTPLGNKIGHQVDYDPQLSLKPYMSDGQFGPTYSLYGVICHAGGGPNSGHYYAFVKSAQGRWFEMNDESVSPHNGLPVKKTAYILFYMRNKGDRLASAISSTQAAPRKSIISSMKKRKERDDEDTGLSSKPFIGPVLPSSDGPSDAKRLKLVNGDPQADAVKKKIQSVEAKSSLASLAQYASDDEEEEDKGQKMEVDNASPSAKAEDTPVKPAKPIPPPTATSTPKPSAPISPSVFYGTPMPNKAGGKQRTPPSSDWRHKAKNPYNQVFRSRHKRRAGAV
ncbi:cysteine proteinase [Hymenopellis radicata]|nr:cysteine proteinase [Hymenopellis radicata]